jgi:hypothetical protein
VPRFLADENFDNDILRGVRKVKPDIDVTRIQDSGLLQAEDPFILDWAARQGCLLMTHDVRTMVGFAYERVAAGLPMPGLFIAPKDIALGEIIDSIVLLAECSLEGEWEGQVVYLPLK